MTTPAHPAPEDRFPRAVGYVLADEGGWKQDPNEPGGAVNMGVSFQTFVAWRKKHGGGYATFLQLREMPVGEAIAIYRQEYAAAIHFAELPNPVDYILLDAAVTLGITGMCNMLGDVLGAEVAHIDDDAIAALKAIADHAGLIDDLCGEWIAIKQKSPRWVRNGPGWTNRNNRVRARAHDMEKKT